MQNGAQLTPPQNFKEAVARFGLNVHGFYIESAEAMLSPYADSKRPEKADELVAKLSRRRAAAA